MPRNLKNPRWYERLLTRLAIKIINHAIYKNGSLTNNPERTVFRQRMELWDDSLQGWDELEQGINYVSISVAVDYET